MFCLYGMGEAGGLVLATAQIPKLPGGTADTVSVCCRASADRGVLNGLL
jgi:hypothetical protein